MTGTAAREEAERYINALPTPYDGWGDWDITAAFIAGAKWRDAQVAELLERAIRWYQVDPNDQRFADAEDDLMNAVAALIEARALSDPGEEEANAC